MLKHKFSFYLFAVLFAIMVSPSQGLAAAAPKAKIIVAKSGGNYTTITAALNAITPSEANPYVIEVWPGTYVENVTMKNYVHLLGTGRDVSTIQSPSSASNVITVTSLSNVEISELTIKGGSSGIRITGLSNALVTRNLITGNGIGVSDNSDGVVSIRESNFTANVQSGIDSSSYTLNVIQNTFINDTTSGSNVIQFGRSPATDNPIVISNNIISGGGGRIIGNGSPVTISGNVMIGAAGIEVAGGNVLVSGNRVSNSRIKGMYVEATPGSMATVTGNVITNSALGGLEVGRSTIATNNRITGSGGEDISSNSADSRVAFNVFDTGTFVGPFNMKSDGTPWP